MYIRSAAASLLIVIRPSSLDVQFVDFDGVRFHLSTPERKTSLLLSMSIRCWDELVKYGVDSIMQREYGSKVTAQPEAEYNVSLEIDLEQLPPEGGEYFCTHICQRYLTRNQRSATLSSGPSHCSSATRSLLHLSSLSPLRKS